MALSPIIGSRLSPPVDGIGDKQLERQRREFMDLIKSDERRHDGDSRRERSGAPGDAGGGVVERRGEAPARTTPATGRNALATRPDIGQTNPQQADAQRLAQLQQHGNPQRLPGQQANPTAQNSQRQGAPASAGGSTSRVAASSAPTASAAGSASSAAVGTSGAMPADAARIAAEGRIAPVMRREREPGSLQPGAASPAMPPVPRPQWPTPPAGSSLVAPANGATGLNLVPTPGANAAFRLSSETPPEVAKRIEQFMLTGLLDRKPFGFLQVAPVVSADRRVETLEEKADRAVADLISEASPHMRRSLAQSGGASAAPLPPEQIAARVAAIAALGINPLARSAPRPTGGGSGVPLTLVASDGALVPDAEDSAEPSAARGASNPLFRIFAGDPEPLDRDEEDYLIKLMAGRGDARRDRIA